MEKNIVFWAIGIIVLAVILFILGGLTSTGNVTKDVEQPLLTIKNPNVQQGYLLEVDIRNIGTTQEMKIFTEAGDYTGKRFFTRATRCKRQNNGMNECDAQFRVPPSLTPGRYYVQAKNMRTGELTGNKALFNVV